MLAPVHIRSTRHSWMWALLPILLAAALSIPLLGVDAFNGDEPAALISSGILRSGPNSLADAWDQTAPRLAPGLPMLLSIWARVVGWNEVAIRMLSVYIGLLSLAWVYRAGRELFAPAAGLNAALLLSASVFYLAYMARADPYALVALCAAQCTWSYWRVALHPQPPGKWAQAGLLLSSVGLLYSHYLCALLLPVLGLFHLFLVPKNHRWWHTALLFGIAILVAALQIPLFIRGLAYTESESLGSAILTAPAVLSHLLRYMTNGLVNPSLQFDVLLFISLPLALLAAILLRRRAGNRSHAVWMLVITSATLLALVIFINEIISVIEETRIRYLMPLWPLCALLVGAALWYLAGRHRRIATVLLSFWLLAGAWLTAGTDFRYELGYFYKRDISLSVPVTAIRKLVPATDYVMMDFSAGTTFQGWFYDRRYGTSRENIFRYKEDPYEAVRPVHADYPFASLLYFSKDRVGFANLPQELGRVLCERVLDEGGLTLERYALHSVENCPDSPVRLAFDSDIQLTVPKISIQNGLLRLDAHFRSADAQLLANYSFAVHVFDTRGERVAQGDTGIGPGYIVPLRSEIDVSGLPPGDYEVRVALYDWRTGERLQARDLETDAGGDMHTLHHFRIG